MEVNPSQELEFILKNSTFEIVEGDFVYAKVKTVPKSNKHFMVTQDKDEITVVTKTENLPQLDLTEKNKETYALIAINVSTPFYSVGFLAAVSSAIAEKGIDLLVVSTYSKDYVMVKKESLELLLQAIKSLGIKEN